MLHRELKITAPQSQDEDARPAVTHKENPTDTQSERWRGRYRKIPGAERSVFNVIQRGLRRDCMRISAKGKPSLDRNPPCCNVGHSGVYGIVTPRFEVL